MGCVALVSAALVYVEYIHMLGFPDGFITELGYAERGLARMFIGISIVLGSFFIYLGRIASRKEVRRKLTSATLVYLVFIICMSLVDYHYHSTLMDGGGG
jgi:hypothetical protein